VKPFIGLIFGGIGLAQSWVPQISGTTVSLRGISAVSATVAWASGSKGTYLRTVDGGTTWQVGLVPGAADMDFRGIYVLSESSAYLLSSGPGPASRIYQTTDAGKTWNLLLINPDPKGFWDAITMWDPTHGIVVGDPVNGRFNILTTEDGLNWITQKGPQASSKEGAFAAGNTCLFARGTREAWFGTGGAGGARVFHSEDSGKTWSVSKTPLRNDSPNAGIFSLAFSSSLHGVAAGGDYMQTTETKGNFAMTEDGGKGWTVSTMPPAGYRSAAAYVAEGKMFLVTGTSGSDFSVDGGRSWKQFDTASYNAMSFTAGAGWAVGPNGAVAKFQPSK
jgi:photosystem II stability/assembly factor-like uncharacterized protein